MPVIKSAKKKLRKDIRITKRNKLFKIGYKKAIKSATKSHTDKTIRYAISSIDKAVKKKLVHKNKAARIKSQLSKLIKKTTKNTSNIKAKSSKK